MSKELMIQEDEFGDVGTGSNVKVILSSMIDFLKENHDAMAFEESNRVLKLKVDESCSISTHCGFVTVTRIK